MNKSYYIVEDPGADPGLIYRCLEDYEHYLSLESAQKAVARCHKDTSFATYFRIVEAETGTCNKFTKTVTVELVS